MPGFLIYWEYGFVYIEFKYADAYNKMNLNMLDNRENQKKKYINKMKPILK